MKVDQLAYKALLTNTGQQTSEQANNVPMSACQWDGQGSRNSSAEGIGLSRDSRRPENVASQ